MNIRIDFVNDSISELFTIQLHMLLGFALFVNRPMDTQHGTIIREILKFFVVRFL